ncbi:Serine/arginine-rich splicing factor SR45 [Penicillium waksmanii]|uniref:Serine/arginine-rich splicing factor SR45 n=1 Tax=Penicillium waksmanii TaxID=69791 RepID=UPI0025479CAA|nr:Serine/arginine-rich splicing factor SR45 [Penicillium waksmanii]KAJ6000135.1 Serine/arginine-rich splicing factor SR45 [Penicillium waksmanii]
MPPRSPRGHSPSRSPPARTRSRSRSPRPREDSRPRSATRSPSPPRGRTRSRSRSKDSRRYRSRSRSYSRSPSRTSSPAKSAKIVVEKLTKNVTEAHLREIFGGFGDIEYLDLPVNRAFMTNRGTAYILYYDPADAEAAIAHMHEAQLDGAVLNVAIEMEDVPDSEGGPMPNRLRADRVVAHVLANATMCIDLSLYHARGPDLRYETDPILDLALRQDEAVLGQRVLVSVDGEVLAIVAMTTVAVVEGLRRQTEPAVAIGIRPEYDTSIAG